MSEGNLHRLAAFSDSGRGGNPAGVWVGERLPSAQRMQRIAADVGFSETAFVAPRQGQRRTVRYFSPLAEVPFCGHATIATGVVLGRDGGPGRYLLDTRAGEVPVTASRDAGGERASLTSVEPRHEPASDGLLREALASLAWQRAMLDDEIPPVRAFAGAWHLVLAVREARHLARLDYDFERLKAVMLASELTTLQLVWREQATRYHVRNPFPVGGVVEDPATGAAAAALGGYLRNAGLLAAPADLTLLQGEAMGRPSRLEVHVPAAGGIVVAGHAAAV